MLVFIVGARRSGSTLLDLLLNNNTQIKSLGEIHRLTQYARSNTELCTCGKPVMECPFWLEVQAEALNVLGVDKGEPLLKTKEVMLDLQKFNLVANMLEQATLLLGWRWLHKLMMRLTAKSHYEAVMNSLFWYDIVRRVTGRPIIVDSSKSRRRFKALYLADSEAFRVIYMVRDGRAVAASWMRRLGMSMEEGANEWLIDVQRSTWSLRWIPSRKVKYVHYEPLCRETEPTIRNVCEFLEVPFDKEMLLLKKTEAHIIGGNPMRFRTEETSIQLDERWRDQLTQEDLLVFDRVAGKWNRRFGYLD